MSVLTLPDEILCKIISYLEKDIDSIESFAKAVGRVQCILNSPCIWRKLIKEQFKFVIPDSDRNKTLQEHLEPKHLYLRLRNIYVHFDYHTGLEAATQLFYKRLSPILRYTECYNCHVKLDRLLQSIVNTCVLLEDHLTFTAIKHSSWVLLPVSREQRLSQFKVSPKKSGDKVSLCLKFSPNNSYDIKVFMPSVVDCTTYSKDVDIKVKKIYFKIFIKVFYAMLNGELPELCQLVCDHCTKSSTM